MIASTHGWKSCSGGTRQRRVYSVLCACADSDFFFLFKIICSYFSYLLAHNALALALHLATELRSKDMCLALKRACDALSDNRAQIVGAIADAAYRLAQSRIGASSVSFV